MIERYFVPVLIGFAPVLLALAGWTYASPGPILTQILSGYSVPIIGMEIVVIIIALREGLIRSARHWMARPIIWLPLAALVAIGFGTALFAAPNRMMALILTSYWMVHLCFAGSVALLCGREFEGRDLQSAYLWGFLALLGLITIFALGVPDPAEFNWTNGFPGFGHIRHMGYLAAAIGGLAIGRYTLASSSRQSWTNLVVLFLAILFVLWCGTRGAAAAMVGGLIVGLILLPAFRKWRTIGGFLLAAGLAVGVASTLPAPAPNMGLTRTVVATTGPASGDLTTGRVEIWRNVFAEVRKRPLFGYGAGQMSYVSPYGSIDQPHNALMQFLLAWGFVGTALIAALGLLYALPAWRTVLSAPNELTAPFLAMLNLAAYAAFDGTLFHPISLSILAGCAGMIASHWVRADNGSQTA
ncbi:O-antigen ligase family protein [Parasphingopyxis sp. CP4]|uniref:O-antigen ligase family protein n=1 Tax=Parasphingopyxis sp. CP4 TaxID=2724527 RepID=UPI0015A2B082|nr:O-antigen ligase family protein [Parasphingopyxis sp. CP4]QLC22453.1 O-antigen ligase family protein [Parasphingopyxis sp. CP4]